MVRPADATHISLCHTVCDTTLTGPHPQLRTSGVHRHGGVHAASGLAGCRAGTACHAYAYACTWAHARTHATGASDGRRCSLRPARGLAVAIRYGWREGREGQGGGAHRRLHLVAVVQVLIFVLLVLLAPVTSDHARAVPPSDTRSALDRTGGGFPHAWTFCRAGPRTSARHRPTVTQ